MIEFLMLAIGIVGFGLAGYWDLKTTEFPDWLPYSLIIAAIGARAAFSFITGDFSFLTDSIFVGVSFLAIGLGMYFLRQWGDGDAWLLGALGFIFPNGSGFLYVGNFPFPLTEIFNVFLVAFFYIIVYSVVLSLMKPGTYKGFVRTLHKDYKGTLALIVTACAAYFVFLVAMFISFRLVPPSPFIIVAFPILITFVAIFARYGMYIEKNLFKKRIPVSKLRVGDVPVGAQWRVLKPAEVKALKRKGGNIWIKEGIRFAPVFLIAMLVTIFLGDIFSILFGLI